MTMQTVTFCATEEGLEDKVQKRRTAPLKRLRHLQSLFPFCEQIL